jgi:hypothetical protein
MNRRADGHRRELVAPSVSSGIWQLALDCVIGHDGNIIVLPLHFRTNSQSAITPAGGAWSAHVAWASAMQSLRVNAFGWSPD